MESAPHHPRRTSEVPRLFRTGVVRGLMWAGGSTPFPRTHSVLRTIRRKHTDSIRA